MNKILVNIICGFIPSKKLRHDVRKLLIKQNSFEIGQQISSCISQIENIRDTYITKQAAMFNRINQINLSTALLHQKTFSKFKNIHNGKDIVIVATGPSLIDKKIIDDAIYIGVNAAFKCKNILLDYLFMQDYSGMKDYIKLVEDYRPDKCIKFFGLTTEYDMIINRVIPENIAIKCKALRYRTDWSEVPFFEPKFAYDISSMPLGCFGSIVFPALQFALWTNPKRIFIMGCDCSNLGHFDGSKTTVDLNSLKLPWRKFKQFKDIYYPETEIISVNPVGLKGLFKDIQL